MACFRLLHVMFDMLGSCGFNVLHKVADPFERNPKVLWEVDFNHYCRHENPFILYPVQDLNEVRPLLKFDNYYTATRNHMSYGITQCYLPPGSGDFPAFTPAEVGTRFSDPGGMQG